MRLKRWEPAASAFIISLLRDQEDTLSQSGCFQSKMGYRLELEAESLLPDTTLAGWTGTKPPPAARALPGGLTPEPPDQERRKRCFLQSRALGSGPSGAEGTCLYYLLNFVCSVTLGTC